MERCPVLKESHRSLFILPEVPVKRMWGELDAKKLAKLLDYVLRMRQKVIGVDDTNFIVRVRSNLAYCSQEIEQAT
jgi:hypothetical protein